MFMGINLSQSDDDVARQHRRSRVGYRENVKVNIDRPGCSFNWNTGQHLPMDKMTKWKSGDQGMSVHQNQRQESRRAASVF